MVKKDNIKIISNLSFRGKRLYRTICELASGDNKNFLFSEKAMDYHLADFGASSAIDELKKNGLIEYSFEYCENMNFKKELWYKGYIL